MSTKTNFKRIAVVAVASLGLGVFTSIAPANAAATATAAATPWNATIAYSGTSTAAATQVVGGTATLTYVETVDTDTALTLLGSITSTGVGTITSATSNKAATADITALGTTAGTETFPNTGVSRIGTTVNDDALLVTYTVVVSSTTAGTQTLTASINDANGTPVSSKTATVTWVAASATGVSAANSTMYVIASGSCQAANTTVAEDKADAATYGVPLIAAGFNALDVCIVAKDGSGNVVALGSGGIITSTFGQSIAVATDSDGYQKADLPAANANLTGPTTITAVLIDTYGNVATLTAGIAYYGSLKTIKLSNISYAAAATSTASTVATYASYDALTASDVAVGVIGVQGFDAKGTPINLGAGTANSITTSTWTVDSDKVAGAPADRTKDTSSFTVRSVFPETGELGASSYGKNAAYVDCGSTKEKLTLTVWGKDSDDAWVKSNSVDFYCSGAVDKITVTASGTSVNVDVVDANGYPVSDRTSVALAASNGSVVAPSTKTTVNGKFATGATFIANSTAATSSVTAIVGTVAGTSAAIKGSGTSIEAQIASMLKLINKIMKRLNIR
jgi:hypothetical protein